MQGYCSETEEQVANQKAQIKDHFTEQVVKDSCGDLYFECFKFWGISIVFTVATLVDVVSDYLYIVTVPTYSPAIKLLLWITLILTLIIYVVISGCLASKTESDKTCCARIISFI